MALPLDSTSNLLAQHHPPEPHAARDADAMSHRVHALEGVIWFAVLVTVARPLTVTLRRPSVVRTLDRVTGIVLVGFGVRLIAESRV